MLGVGCSSSGSNKGRINGSSSGSSCNSGRRSTRSNSVGCSGSSCCCDNKMKSRIFNGRNYNGNNITTRCNCTHGSIKHRVGVMVAEVLAMEVVVVALLLHWLMEMLFRELLH